VPLVVRETLIVTVAPGAPDADESESEAVCAEARSTARKAIKRKRTLVKVCPHVNRLDFII
jgi:hypothetical protein